MAGWDSRHRCRLPGVAELTPPIGPRADAETRGHGDTGTKELTPSAGAAPHPCPYSPRRGAWPRRPVSDTERGNDGHGERTDLTLAGFQRGRERSAGGLVSFGQMWIASLPPPGAPPDVAAAWPAMCPPVRARYGAEARPNRARAIALRWLRWEAGRRLRARSGGAAVPLDAEILAIQPDHLGGVLLTTPAFRLLKEALPQARLTVLAGPWSQDVPEHCPAVDRVRVCHFPGFERGDAPQRLLDRAGRRVEPYVRLLAVAGELAQERFHLAISFHTDYWWGAALSALAGIPVRLGYATPESAPFLTHALPLARPMVGREVGRPEGCPSCSPFEGRCGETGTEAQAGRPHVAEMHLALAREALRLAGQQPPSGFDGRMVYEPTAAERAEAWRLWRANDLDEAPAVVVMHPAPGAPVKRWAAPRFALVADHLAGRYGARVVITGGRRDLDEARRIAAACWHRPVVLAGQTTFGVLAALLDRCRLAIGTDNGAMHLASARGVPTLRIFGPTDARVWRHWSGAGEPCPWGEISSARPCAPCHRLDVPPWDVAMGLGPEQAFDVAYPCLEEVATEQVIEAVERLWALTEGR